MRDYSKLFKRVQAWVLTVAMLLPVLNCGLFLGVSAADKTPTLLTEGEIVADNYDLTDAEEALLSSGLLVGETHSIYYPTDNDELVAVDDKSKAITAEKYTDDGGYIWVPVSAEIVVNSAVKETVTLVDGKATYTYDGNAFSVRVLYRLYIEIYDATQTTLLNTAGALKQGLANMNTISSSTGKTGLGAVETAIDVLKLLADGVSLGWASAQFAVDAQNAAYALRNQITANGGVLDLSKTISQYSASTSKTRFIIENDVREEFVNTYMMMKAIKEDPLTNNTLLDSFLQANQPQNYTLWMNLKGIIGSWVDTMAPVVEDAWAIESMSVTKAGMTDLEWTKLDALVADIDEISANVVKNPLVAAETSVQLNMSMFNVTVNVQLMVAGADAGQLVAKDQKTTVVTLEEGASKAAILAAVTASGLENSAVAEWAASGLLVAEHFETKTSALSDSLTQDTTYTITYSPKYYTITYSYSESTQAPYGFNMVLPVCNTANRVYDYKVNGESYYQGAMITILGDTNITRTEGKAYDLSMSLNNMVSNVYFSANADASAILTSGALTVGNDMLNIRTPENTLSIQDDQLSAVNYASNYAGLIWTPTTYTLVGGADNGASGAIVAGKADLSGKSYEQVVVTYKLALSNFSNADVLDLVNLPYDLYQDAEGQLSVLERLKAQSGSLSSLNNTLLGFLAQMVTNTQLNEDPAKNAALQAEFTEIINGIMDDCLDNTGVMKLCNLVDGYKNGGGLAYYYRNSAAFLTELDILSGYLSDLVDTEDKVNALTILIASAGSMAEGYEDKILDAEAKMAQIKADLTAPHAAIDTSSKNLNVLATALTAAQSANLKKYATLPSEFAITRTASVEAPDKQSAKITLYAPNGDKIEISKVFDQGHTLTPADISALKDEVLAAVATLNLPEFFYNTNFKADQLLVGYEGKAPSEVSLSYEWYAKSFTVQVPGAADQTISVDDLTINLPASATFGVRYEYTIGAKTGLTGTYTFTLAEIEALFVDGSYSVARTEIDMNEEDLIKFVNNLNDAVDGNLIRFALVKGAKGYSIIMKVDAAQPRALAGAAQGMAMGFVQSGYAYIGLDGNGVLANSQISLQAIIDAVMASGFSTQSLIDAINSNGSVNNMAIPGDVLAGDMATAGGKLIATTMNIGNSLADSQALGFYITLGSAPSQLVQIRDLLAGKVGNYLKVVCVDGKATVQMTLPEKAYQAYLAALLVTDNLDIRNINAANGEIAIGFIKDFMDPLFVGDVTLETVSNTLSAFGYDVDLDGYEDLYAKLCAQYEKTEIQYDEKSGHATRTFSIKSLVDSMDIPEALAGMIKEYDTGITLTAAICVENLDNEYEALFVDVRANGVTNKIGLTKDLSAKLNNLSGASVIVLMSDIEGDLVLPYTMVLNLNGFTVNGSIKCTGNVTIVDSSVLDGEVGTVNGIVSGNATILGGKYAQDVTAFLKSGYVQKDDNTIGNEFYNFVKDANGDITIQIDAGIAATETMPDLKSMLIDLAVDMLFNGYTTNSLYINSNLVYDMTMDDFVGIYTGDDRINTLVHKVVGMVDSSELAKIINQLSADLTNFDNLQNAIANDKPIISYPMTTGAWDIVLEHAKDGDYLTISIASNHIQNRNLHVKFVGTEEDKDLLADLMGVLKDTTDVDVQIDMNHGFTSADDKNLVLNGSGYANINVDFSNNYDYAIMFSILLADGIGGTARENLVSGIKTYYETLEISELMTAFNAVTTAQAIAAVKNIARNDTFSAMINNLGLTDVVSSDVMDLQAIFENYIKIVAAVVRKSDVTGGNSTLGSYYKASLGGYGFSKDNMDKTYARELFKGYSVTLNVAVNEISVIIDIFGDATPVVIDYTELKNTIAKAEALNHANYTFSTWNALQDVLATANALVDNADKQAQVDNMVLALNDAINALVDISVLKAVVLQVESLNAADYTVDSWNAVWTLYLQAKDMLNGDPDQLAVYEMTAHLTDAIDALVEIQIPDIEELDYSVLIALIQQVESLDPAEYTEDTWNVVWALYEQAKALLDNAENQGQIDALAADLAAAIAYLLPADIDGVFVPVEDEHEDLAGIQLDEDGIHILIDAHSNGLSAAELMQILEVDGSAGYTFTVEDIDDKAGLVYTGATIVIGIYRDGVKIGERKFTAVVLGDIDGDGRATAKDANFMAIHYTSPDKAGLNATQIAATDTNQDGVMNAKDALVISYKYVYWDEYTTFVGA